MAQAYNYIATAQPPTAVTHSLVGNFTAAKDINLIVAQCTRIELYKLAPHGLQPVTTFNLYGRIAVMKLVRMPGDDHDCLFMSTERYHFVALEWNAETNEIRTRANGDIKDKIGRPRDRGQIGVVDPLTRLVGLHLYDGLLKIIPIEQQVRMQLRSQTHPATPTARRALLRPSVREPLGRSIVSCFCVARF